MKIIVTGLFLATVASSFVPGKKRTAPEPPCKNIRGNEEICGHDQFCSVSILEAGCRNCTEVAENWCTTQEKIWEFKKKFPKCAVQCELKTCNMEKEEVETLREALEKLEKKNAELEKNDTLLKALAGVSFGSVLVCFITIGGMIVYISKCKQRLKDQAAGLADYTAVVESNRSFWQKCCPPRNGRRTVQPGDGNPENTAFLPGPTPGSSTPASDSALGNRCTSTLDVGRLPTGGTLHHPSDTNDFMLHSQMADTCGGGGVNDATTTATSAV